MNNVAPGDLPLRHPGGIRQRTHTAVGEEDVVDGELRLRNECVHLGEEVLNLIGLRTCGSRLVIVQRVGAPDQKAPHPRNDQNKAPVGLRLVVDHVSGRTLEGVNNNVAAL